MMSTKKYRIKQYSQNNFQIEYTENGIDYIKYTKHCQREGEYSPIYYSYDNAMDNINKLKETDKMVEQYPKIVWEE